MANRVVIMRGVPGSGKSSKARWLASLSKRSELDCFWVEDSVTYFGRPSLGWLMQDLAKQGLSADHISAEDYPHEAVIHAVIHSTDEYFMKDGVYRFNPAKIGLNHSKNYKAFRRSVDAEIPLVIVDNTNTVRHEWAKYQNYAKDSDYWVSFCVLPHPTLAEAAARNTHGVPSDVIKKMIARFE